MYEVYGKKQLDLFGNTKYNKLNFGNTKFKRNVGRRQHEEMRQISKPAFGGFDVPEPDARWGAGGGGDRRGAGRDY